MTILLVFDLSLLSWCQAGAIQQQQGVSASPADSLLSRQVCLFVYLKHTG